MAQHHQEHSHLITDLEKCDFRPMYLHFEAEKAAKKAMTAAEKKAAKAAKYVYVDVNAVASYKCIPSCLLGTS